LIAVTQQDTYPVQPWLAKISKMAQPDLDFMPPEIQLQKSKYAVPACDAFSLGLFICSIYNGGRSLIQAQYNPACYVKELGRVRAACCSVDLLGQLSSTSKLRTSPPHASLPNEANPGAL